MRKVLNTFKSKEYPVSVQLVEGDNNIYLVELDYCLTKPGSHVVSQSFKEFKKAAEVYFNHCRMIKRGIKYL